MSSLADAARDARAHADTRTEPGCHAVANALEGALAAEKAKEHQPASIEGIPSAVEAGYVSEVRILKGGTEN
jgi:hypothetical protein